MGSRQAEFRHRDGAISPSSTMTHKALEAMRRGIPAPKVTNANRPEAAQWREQVTWQTIQDFNCANARRAMTQSTVSLHETYDPYTVSRLRKIASGEARLKPVALDAPLQSNTDVPLLEKSA